MVPLTDVKQKAVLVQVKRLAPERCLVATGLKNRAIGQQVWETKWTETFLLKQGSLTVL